MVQQAPLILGVAGAAVGSFFGVPAIGFLVGSTLGGFIAGQAGPNSKVEGPIPPEIQLTESSQGKPITVIFGEYRLAGNIIYFRQEIKKIKKKSKSGGKGSRPSTKTTEYRRMVDMAVGICQGEADMVEIWANNDKLFDSATGDRSNLLGDWNFYRGSETQNPDPFLQSIWGLENVSAHRGLSYIVFKNWDLSGFNNNLPNLRFVMTGSSSPILPYSTVPPSDIFGTGWTNHLGDNNGPHLLPDNRTLALYSRNSSNSAQIRIIHWDLISRQRTFISEILPNPTNTASSSWLNQMNYSTNGWTINKLTTTNTTAPVISNYITGETRTARSWDHETQSYTTSFTAISVGSHWSATNALNGQLRFWAFTGAQWAGGFSNTTRLFTSQGDAAWRYDNSTTGPVVKSYIGTANPVTRGGVPSHVTPGAAWTLIASSGGFVFVKLVPPSVPSQWKPDGPLYTNSTTNNWLTVNQTELDLTGQLTWPGTTNADYGYAEEASTGSLFYIRTRKLAPRDTTFHRISPTGVLEESRSMADISAQFGLTAITGSEHCQDVNWATMVAQLRVSPYLMIRTAMVGRMLKINVLDFNDVRIVTGFQDALGSNRDHWKLYEVYNNSVYGPYLNVSANWAELLLDRFEADETILPNVVNDLMAKSQFNSVEYDVTDLFVTEDSQKNDPFWDDPYIYADTARRVRGYAITQVQPLARVIADLAIAYRFVDVETGGKIHFRRLNRAPIPVTIADTDLRAAQNQTATDLITEVVTDVVDLPTQVSVRYIDQDFNRQQGHQLAKLRTTGRDNTEVVDINVVMTADEANKLAHEILFTRWAERRQFRGSCSLAKMAVVEPADVVRLNVNTPTVKYDGYVRITKLTLNGGVVEWEGVSHDPGIYLTVGNVVVQGGSQEDTDQTVTDTALSDWLFVDSVALDDNQVAGAGFYIVGESTGKAEDYLGGILNRRNSIGNMVELTTLETAAFTGFVLEGLPATNSNIHFSGDSIRVRVYDPEFEFPDFTKEEIITNPETGLLIGSPLSNWELIQYTTATDLGDNEWLLEGIIRGRRGSCWHTGAISSGLNFVFLGPDEPFQRQNDPNNLINETREYEFIPFGSSQVPLTSQFYELKSRNLMPLPPYDLQTFRNGNSVKATWKRQARSNFVWANFSDVPLDEPVEVYRVQALNIHREVIQTHAPSVREQTLTLPDYPILRNSDAALGTTLFWNVISTGATTFENVASFSTMPAPVFGSRMFAASHNTNWTVRQLLTIPEWLWGTRFRSRAYLGWSGNATSYTMNFNVRVWDNEALSGSPLLELIDPQAGLPKDTWTEFSKVDAVFPVNGIVLDVRVFGTRSGGSVAGSRGLFDAVNITLLDKLGYYINAAQLSGNSLIGLGLESEVNV